VGLCSHEAVVIVRVDPASLAKPSGFSHAVVGSGRVVFLAGQTALDADGHLVAVGDVVGQFERALSNLLTALAGAGGQPADLASITIYIVDMPGYRARAREIGAVWRRLAGREYPAAAGVGVTRLWDDEALVEIQGYAILD
jgi:enamine deaminase RidA (YjgF/YER057c/UK114 family)